MIISSEQVLFLTVKLPPMAKSKIAQAIPGAVEESLLNSIDDNHFAWPHDVDPSQPIPVAVINKRALQKIVEPQTSDIIPDIFLLPYHQDAWSLQWFDDRLVIRTGAYRGFCLHQRNYQHLLPLYLAKQAKQAKQQTMPALHYYRESHHADLKIDAEIITHPLTEEPRLQTPLINLCQGGFQTRKRIGSQKKLWRRVLILAGLWLMLSLVGKVLALHMLNRQAANYDRQIAHDYHQAFPEATSLVSPRFRIEQALKKYQSGAGDTPLFNQLSRFGKALDTNKNIRLSHFIFTTGRLVMTVKATSINELDQFSKTLKKQGLDFHQQVSSNDQHIIATILITGARHE